jgi:hypothetical protein
MGVSSVNGRLDEIERQLADLVPEETPERRAFAERWERLTRELSATMDPAHVEAHNRYLEANGGRVAWPGDGPARLVNVVENLLTLAHLNQFPMRLALPRTVGEVYLQGRGWPFDQCVSCGLLLPYEHEYWRGGQRVPSIHWFTRCPDCGGAVQRRPSPPSRHDR